MSSVGDDVTQFTAKLSVLEQHLFKAGVSSSAAFLHWKTYGKQLVRTSAVGPAVVSPTRHGKDENDGQGMDDDDNDDDGDDYGEDEYGHRNKKQRRQ